jgi:2-keto-4-pentenoate hydratase
MTEAILGVRWSGPASPTVVQSTGDHDTEVAVLILDEMFPEEDVNIGASSTASPHVKWDGSILLTYYFFVI